VQDATLDKNSEAESYFVSLIKDHSPGNKHRTTGISGEYVIFDLGSATAIKAIYIDGSNVVSGDTTYTFKAGTTSACTDESMNLTKATKSHHEITWSAYRYYRIDVTKASGTYWEIGKACMPKRSYEPALDWEEGYQDGLKTGIMEVDGFSGQQANTFLYTAATRRLPFRGISDAQKDAFFNDLMAEIPINQGVVLYDHVRSTAFYGKLIFQNAIHNYNNNWDCEGYFTESK
jgi:hypothetical protein